MSDILMQIGIVVTILFLLFSSYRVFQYWRVVSTWIDPRDLHKKLEDGEDILVLDVRTAEEYEKDGHIKDSVNLPISDLAYTLLSNRAEFKKYHNQMVVVICRVGGRSTTAVTQLRKFGLNGAIMSRGGIEEWKRYGFPVVQK